MITFIGDYTCRLDNKGRVLLPAALIKQMNQLAVAGKGGMQDRFVIKKDIFESCLLLYPMDEWQRQNEILRNNTNPFNREHNKFLRGFFKGIAELSIDASNRLLIPKRLLDSINAEREIVLAGQFGKIEIWSKDLYETVESGDERFASLAEKIMGNTLHESDKQT
ncbi:MAG: protein mraZ [Bacteroidales bacterium]|nr:protein mraZ [Bacteroidales bacterium]